MRTGLANIGNTCYMNALLQCLVHCPELVQQFALLPPTFSSIRGTDPESQPIEIELNPLFRQLISDVVSGRKSVVSAQNIQRILIRNHLDIADGSQHDAHEFFMVFLQLMEEEQNMLLGADGNGMSRSLLAEYPLEQEVKEWWDQFIKHNPSTFTSVFYGSMVTTIRCNNCLHESRTISSFNSLFVSIPQERFQISVNVVIEYSSEQGICSYQVNLAVHSGQTLRSLSNKLCKYMETNDPCSFVFLLGTQNQETHSIQYTLCDKDTSLSVLLSATKQSILIAYYVPIAATQLDLNNIFFLSSVKVLATTSSSICLINACLPLLLVRDATESNDIFQRRVSAIQALIFTDSPASFSHAMENVDRIRINVDSLVNNLFYRAGDIVTDNQPCMTCFLRQMSENDLSCDELLHRANGDREWNKFNVVSFICEVSIPEGIDVSDLSEVTPSRNDLMSILHCRLHISLSMIHCHRLDDSSELKLEDCFSISSMIDNLGPCSACGKNTSYLMQQCYPKLPPILVIVLKRFAYTVSRSANQCTYSSSKIMTVIDFPFEGLDLHSIINGERDCLYDLCCVCHHCGTSEGGHYVAYCREGDRWYEYDDELVHEVSEDEIRSENAYILFYQKRDGCMKGTEHKNSQRGCDVNSDTSKRIKLEKNLKKIRKSGRKDGSKDKNKSISASKLTQVSRIKKVMDKKVHLKRKQCPIYFVFSMILLLIVILFLNL